MLAASPMKLIVECHQSPAALRQTRVREIPMRVQSFLPVIAAQFAIASSMAFGGDPLVNPYAGLKIPPHAQSSMDFELSHGSQRTVAVDPLASGQSLERLESAAQANAVNRLPAPFPEMGPSYVTVSDNFDKSTSHRAAVLANPNGSSPPTNTSQIQLTGATSQEPTSQRRVTPFGTKSSRRASSNKSSSGKTQVPAAKPSAQTTPKGPTQSAWQRLWGGSKNSQKQDVTLASATQPPVAKPQASAPAKTAAAPPVNKTSIAQPTEMNQPARFLPVLSQNQAKRATQPPTVEQNHASQAKAAPTAHAPPPVVNQRSMPTQQVFSEYSLVDSEEMLGDSSPGMISGRPTILYRPAVAGVDQSGQTIFRPDVRVADARGQFTSVAAGPREGQVTRAVDSETGEPIPDEVWAQQMGEIPLESYAPPSAGYAPAPRLGPVQDVVLTLRAVLNGPRSPQAGIGTERVMHAISFIDTTQPMNNFRLRVDAASNYRQPDRSEYFWAKVGQKGPNREPLPNIGETAVNYQDIRAYLEVGGPKFSVGTDLPIRVIDPELYGNSGGFGDMNILTKIVFLTGDRWQLTNLLRVYIPSGDAARGLGTGHASIEPGFAWRYKWSDVTYLHGDLKFWVPLGADEVHGGEVLSYGIAMSHVWRDSDCYAVMPTLELVGYSFLDGQVTIPGALASDFVDPEGVFNVHPGVRWVWDKGSDCGIQEFGIFGGFGVSAETLYENILRAELRWTF